MLNGVAVTYARPTWSVRQSRSWLGRIATMPTAVC